MGEYKVFVKTNEQRDVIDINSEIFLDTRKIARDGWILIDKGSGDRYAHAQGNYLDGPLYDERNRPRYKLVNGSITRKA